MDKYSEDSDVGIRNGILLDLFSEQLKANAKISMKLDKVADKIEESVDLQKKLCEDQNKLLLKFEQIPSDVKDMKRVVRWIKWSLLPLTASLIGIIIKLLL